MKKPVPKKSPQTPSKAPGIMAALPVTEIIGRVSDTVGAIYALRGEEQKTKQVIATMDTRKFEAREETHRTLIKAGERHHELDNAELDSERQHKQAMAELQLRAEHLAHERELVRQQAEKDITDTDDCRTLPHNRKL